jgi:hypothetical protein
MRRQERTLDELDKVVKGKHRDEKIIVCLYKLEENVLSLRNDLQLATGTVISSRTVLETVI